MKHFQKLQYYDPKNGDIILINEQFASKFDGYTALMVKTDRQGNKIAVTLSDDPKKYPFPANLIEYIKVQKVLYKVTETHCTECVTTYDLEPAPIEEYESINQELGNY